MAPHMVRVASTIGVLGNDKFDNSNPRGEGSAMISRANAAHNNGLESFPLFAAGVLGAVAMKADMEAVGQLSALYLVVRTGFNVVYITSTSQSMGALRSTLWLVGQVAACQLLALAASEYDFPSKCSWVYPVASSN